MHENITLGKSEWVVMEQLWGSAPRTYAQLCHALAENPPGWSRSTVQTMLERMTGKGLLRYEVVGRARQYSPTVSRNAVAMSETKSLLERAFDGSASMMMNALVQGEMLTRQEVAELYAILEEMEGAK